MTDTYADIQEHAYRTAHPDEFCPCGASKHPEEQTCGACVEEEIEERSLALLDEIKPTVTERRRDAARYAELKREYRILIPSTGEVFTPEAWERECKALNTELKAYIENTGEAIEIEGQPPLKVTPSSTTWYRIAEMIDADSDLWLECMDIPGLVKLDSSMVAAAQKIGKLQRLSKYAVRGDGASRLEFDRRWKP